MNDSILHIVDKTSVLKRMAAFFILWVVDDDDASDNADSGARNDAMAAATVNWISNPANLNLSPSSGYGRWWKCCNQSGCWVEINLTIMGCRSWICHSDAHVQNIDRARGGKKIMKAITSDEDRYRAVQTCLYQRRSSTSIRQGRTRSRIFCEGTI